MKSSRGSPSFERALLYLHSALIWVAVKELNFSYYMGETILITIYIYIDILYTKYCN